MSAHTPSPWSECAAHADIGGDLLIYDENYRTIRAGKETGNTHLGFRITGFISPADARLIAAAPDLLDALTDLVRQVELFCERYGEADFFTGAARAAIAKARDEL